MIDSEQSLKAPTNSKTIAFEAFIKVITRPVLKPLVNSESVEKLGYNDNEMTHKLVVYLKRGLIPKSLQSHYLLKGLHIGHKIFILYVWRESLLQTFTIWQTVLVAMNRQKKQIIHGNRRLPYGSGYTCTAGQMGRIRGFIVIDAFSRWVEI